MIRWQPAVAVALFVGLQARCRAAPPFGAPGCARRLHRTIATCGLVLLSTSACTSSSGVQPPTDRRPEEFTIGDTTLTVETALYQGRVASPSGYPVALDTVTVWSGFGGSVSVGRDGRFQIRMNTNATGLVVARDAAGSTLFLTVFPASPDLLDRELVLDADSTARVLVFTQPFVAVGHPIYDALVLEAIGELPEAAALATTLATRLVDNPYALDDDDPTVASALAVAADALAAAIDASAGGGTGSATSDIRGSPAPPPPLPESEGRFKDGDGEADISNLWFADVDGTEADRVQFLAFTPNDDRSSAAVWEQNWRARWVFYHLDRPGDPTDRPLAALAALAPPRKYELPGFGMLLGSGGGPSGCWSQHYYSIRIRGAAAREVRRWSAS